MFAEFVMPGLFDGIALRDRQHGDGGWRVFADAIPRGWSSSWGAAKRRLEGVRPSSFEARKSAHLRM